MGNNILILGGTGKTGRRVAERLTKLKVPVTIGSRKAIPAFDWENPATWEDVLHAAAKVYITFQPDLAVPSALTTIKGFVAAAKKSDIKHLVLLSGRGEKEAEACENVIINSGLNWTIVRASWFMQNFSESFLLDSILANNVVLPVINTKEPFIDADDIADVVVETLLNESHSRKIYELTGPQLLTFENSVSQIADITKRSISYQELPIDEYVSFLRNYHIPEDFIWLIKYLFTEVLDGRNESITTDVEKVIGRKPGTFENYVLKTHQTDIWNNDNGNK